MSWSRRSALRPHLTRALGAVVHGPLVSVLAHNAVVDADAAVDPDAGLDQLVLVRLEGGGRRGRQSGLIGRIRQSFKVFGNLHSWIHCSGL